MTFYPSQRKGYTDTKLHPHYCTNAAEYQINKQSQINREFCHEKHACNCVKETGARKTYDGFSVPNETTLCSNHLSNSVENELIDVKCNFCWYVNRIFSYKIKTAQEGFLTHIRCMYCSNDINIENIHLPHPSYQTCQQSSFYLDKPYCKGKMSQKEKTNFLHENCKYCQTSYEASASSGEDFVDLDDQYIACRAHDISRRYNSCLDSSQFDQDCSYVCGKSSNINHIEKMFQGINMSLFPLNETWKSNCFNNQQFRPCEYCWKNGESAVICNSHQFQNASGIVTCPLVRRYKLMSNIHYSPYSNTQNLNYNNPVTHELCTMPCFYHNDANRQKYTHSF